MIITALPKIKYSTKPLQLKMSAFQRNVQPKPIC
jgi:hypothetical protein